MLPDEKLQIRQKQKARKFALQAIYQWSMTGQDVIEIEAQFHETNAMEKVDTAYFSRLLRAIPQHCPDLDTVLEPFLDRPIATLTPIELAILRLGAYELAYCPDIPYRIVLDEWVSLTKQFGTVEGHRYVNGVLNNLAVKLRTIERNRG